MTLLTSPPSHVAAPLSPLSRADEHGDRPALITPEGEVVTHAALRAMVDDLAAQLPPSTAGRLLVQHNPRPDISSVAAYLAILEAGHVALVTGECSAAITDRYRPDVRVDPDGDRPFTMLADQPQHLLHPDLALLLSTSGSTGSPKLVKLSHRNVTSNARAIADALRLTGDDRAITTLPLHYCFGLSVLHSHLTVGGSLVLHPGSVLEDDFWQAADRHRVTNLAAVPHTLELMASTDVLTRRHPALRLIYQAGGRLPADRVAETAALGARQGWEFAVMYGQTEATARICVLEPQLVAANPDAVGHPVAHTTVHLDTSVPEARDGSGEVVVRGPGVMMGYAEHPDDLALGGHLRELRTGDLGKVDASGLLRIVGRRSGFAKVMGLRVDLTRVERALEEAGLSACVGGDDHGLAIVVEPDEAHTDHQLAATARTTAVAASGLGPASVRVLVARLSRRENGKVDRAGCLALVRSTGGDDPGDGASDDGAGEVARVIADVLGLTTIDPERSFVELGGDSLSHVQASTRLGSIVGELPNGWQHVAVGQLAELATRPARRPRRQSRACAAWGPGSRLRGSLLGRVTSRWQAVETSVLLRAIAVITICGTHADLFRLLGGAHTLMAVAGFNAAAFGLALPTVGARWRATARTVLGIALPTALVALWGMWRADRYGWANVALANWLFGDLRGKVYEFWFVEALAACWLVVAALLALPPVARAWRRDPWRVAIVLTGLALIPRFVILETMDGHVRGMMPTTLWLFAVGAAAATATTSRRRLITLGIAVLGGSTYFADDVARTAVVLGGIALLCFVPRVRLPRWVMPVAGVLAAASLHIYLVQFQVLAEVEHALGGTLAALAVGCVFWLIADRPVRRLQRFIPLSAGSAVEISTVGTMLNPTGRP